MTAADGSTPAGLVQITAVSTGAGGASILGYFPFGGMTVCPGEGSWTFEARNGNYFTERGGSATCSMVDGNLSCSGSFSFNMSALRGSFSGTVTWAHSGKPAANVDVYASQDNGSPCGIAVTFVRTDANGNYTFNPAGEPDHSNNWGLPVYDLTYGGGAAEAPRTGGSYLLRASQYCDDSQPGGTSSSKKTVVNLVVEAPERADLQCLQSPAPQPAPAPGSIGKPVSIVTGNVYFDHTDLAYRTLPFVRSYNSANAAANRGGVFGRGWTHSFERSLSVPEASVLLFRQANGVAIYYQDLDGDLTYRASLPITDRSWIVKSATTGAYTRYLLDGASESYDSAGRLLGITTSSGQTTSLTRDASGTLSAINEPSGGSVTFNYDASSRIQSVSGPAGVVAVYAYDISGRLDKVTYADGSGYSFVYDISGLVLSVSDLSGMVLERHEYDAQSRGLTSEISNGREKFTLTYSPRKTTVTDALGNVTTYDWSNFSGVRQVTKVTGPCSSCGGGREFRRVDV